jgi:L-fuconolactonase
MTFIARPNVVHPFRAKQIEPRQEWLAQRTEKIIEPGLPIIDPHHHLWDWAPVFRYLFDDVMADVRSGHHICATVSISGHSMFRADGDPDLKPVGETEFFNGIAAMTASGIYGPVRLCAGIVGFAELRLGARVERVLEAHIQAGGGRFRGTRYSSHWGPDEDAKPPHGRPKYILADKAFREGFAKLAPLSLSFDARIFHHQADELVDLARAFPDTTINLCHIATPLGGGKAERRDELFPVWHAGIRDLAKCPNINVKLGGMGMGREWGFGFEHRPLPPSSTELAAAWGPWLSAVIEAFGADRCMFQSNFPPDKGTCSYPIMWNAFKRIAAGCSADEKAALFAGSAARAYRLPDSVWR